MIPTRVAKSRKDAAVTLTFLISNACGALHVPSGLPIFNLSSVRRDVTMGSLARVSTGQHRSAQVSTAHSSNMEAAERAQHLKGNSIAVHR